MTDINLSFYKESLAYRLLCICITTFAALVKESSLKISSITHSHSILSLDTAQQKYAPVEFADNPTHR